MAGVLSVFVLKIAHLKHAYYKDSVTAITFPLSL